MRFIGNVPGFAQRTYDEVEQTKFLPKVENLPFHRSSVTQSLIVKDLMEFAINKTERPQDVLFTLAVREAYEAFKLPERAKPLHLNDVFLQDLDIWSKSPGLPWRDHGYKTKNDIRRDPEAIRRVRYFWHKIKRGDTVYPPDCLAYVRSHVCPINENKVRAVWGYPATITFGEAMFAVPLIRSYQKHGPIAYGYETAIGGMKKVCERFSKFNAFAGIDFKKFDKNVPAWLIEIAFAILVCNVDFVHYEGTGTIDAVRSGRAWNYIVKYFTQTTIRTARGLRFRKTSGIASGSYFTQLVGSIVNYILITWAYLHQFGIPPADILVMGDDSLSAGSSPLDLKAAEELLSSIGMSINMEKSQITTELMTMKFLGYSIGNGVPRKDHLEWLTALYFPEKPDECMDELQSRAIGLLYASMGLDDKFYHLCSAIITFRPFDLIISRNFERHLKFIGVSLDKLKDKEVPRQYDFMKYWW